MSKEVSAGGNESALEQADKTSNNLIHMWMTIKGRPYIVSIFFLLSSLTKILSTNYSHLISSAIFLIYI